MFRLRILRKVGDSMKKKVIRLKVKELMKAQIDKDITTDAVLAKKIGVSPSQVWRAKLPINDNRYNAPGTQFIAGVLDTFVQPFENFFYLDEIDTENKQSTDKQEKVAKI